LLLIYLSAIYNFDTSVVNLEALQQIYEVVSISVTLKKKKNLVLSEILKPFYRILTA